MTESRFTLQDDFLREPLYLTPEAVELKPLYLTPEAAESGVGFHVWCLDCLVFGFRVPDFVFWVPRHAIHTASEQRWKNSKI